MIDLDKERKAFEATRVGEFVNVEFEVNDYWKTGHYKEKTSHYEDLEESHTLSMSWFAWLARAELAQAEVTELKQKLEAKHRAFVFLDDCRKEWHKSFMFKCEQLEELKKKLARYENPDYVLVPRELTESMRKEGREKIEYGKLCADAVYKAMIEAVENGNFNSDIQAMNKDLSNGVITGENFDNLYDDRSSGER